MSALHVVRFYDGFDNEWIDITEPISIEEANKVLAEKTDNGTKNSQYADIDYYRIFPANSIMMYSQEWREQHAKRS